MAPLMALPNTLAHLPEQSVLIFEASFTLTWAAYEALQVTRNKLKSHFSGYIFSQLNKCICLQLNNLCYDHVIAYKLSCLVSDSHLDAKPPKKTLTLQEAVSMIPVSALRAKESVAKSALQEVSALNGSSPFSQDSQCNPDSCSSFPTLCYFS